MKILQVQNASDMVMDLDQVLETMEDCTSVVLAGYEEALEWSRSHTPDLTVVGYPDDFEDALTFIGTLKNEHLSDTFSPILLFCNEQFKIQRIRAIKAGVSDFLSARMSLLEQGQRLRHQGMLKDYHEQIRHPDRTPEPDIVPTPKDLNERDEQVFLQLARAAEFYDAYTAGHLRRVGDYAHQLARAINLPDRECDLLKIAGRMHDIGKLGVTQEILRKPGALTDSEFEIIQTHPEIGAEILQGDSELVQTAAIVALNHHERWDGEGYPRALAGEDIPLLGRIAALADTFDAITTTRPYQPADSPDRAFEILQHQRGKQFDPRLVDQFLELTPTIESIHRQSKASRPPDSEMTGS